MVEGIEGQTESEIDAERRDSTHTGLLTNLHRHRAFPPQLL